MHSLFLAPTQQLPFFLSFLWFLWFIVTGGVIAWIMHIMTPIEGPHDAWRRSFFTFIVLFGTLFFARIPETFIVYGTIFREGPSVIYWTAGVTLGTALGCWIISKLVKPDLRR